MVEIRPNMDALSEANTVSELSVSVDSQSDTVTIDVGKQTLELSRLDALRLRKSINNTFDGEVPSVPALKIAKASHNSKHPWHVKHEEGCHQGQTVEALYRDLNLAALADRADMSISTYINQAFCNTCASSVQVWHNQRQIYVSTLLDELRTETINSYVFTTVDVHQGPCDLCGTPESGVSFLPVAGSVHGNTGPYWVCLTCRDVLINGIDIGSLPISSHPTFTSYYTPDGPVTSTGSLPPPPSEELILDDLRELPEQEFVRIVGSFDDVTSGRAEKLYELGYDSIPELADTKKRELTDVTLVGDATAVAIRNGARQYATQYVEDNRKPPE